MPVTINQIDVRACASSVMAALTDLQGYLSAAVNPDRVALADLEMEPMGWTRRVYSEKAFQIWQKQLKLFPDDPLILHHMAIMHHARAFDLEDGPKPAESDADWTAALHYWHRLHGMDAFWDKLTAKACAGTARQDAIKRLRADFPQMILAIHYDIALDKETREKKKTRAKFHIGLVHKAPFAAPERNEAQRAAYNRYIKVVPDEVWQPNELREDVLAKGQQAIVEYLNYDPGCIPVLEDALRLQRRVQRSRNTAWQALSPGDPKRNAILLLEKKDAQAWRPFFDQLVAVADQLEEEVREDLARWYHGRGSDLCALDEHEKAIEFYERAVGVCRPEEDERKVCVRGLVQTLAHVARGKAIQEEAGARAYCDKIRQRGDLTVIACWLLAQAYTRLQAFDVALAVCDTGLAIEPDFDDLEADEWTQRLSEFKQEVPILKQMSAGKSAMEAGKPADALRPLNEAERLVKATGTLRRHNSIYWLRAQAHLAVDRIAEAKRDLDLYVELLDNTSSPSDIEAGKKLKEIIAAQELMSNIKPLLDKAKQALEAGRFKDALTPLNEAARKAPDNDVIYFLRAQAHAALGNIADAKQDAKIVADRAETAEDREHARRLDEMIAEAQTASVIRGLLEKARQAMEAGRFKDALTPLNEAAKKVPDNDAIYFLRTQAHVALGNLADAERDAKTMAGLAKTAQDREHARRLDEMIAKARTAGAIKGLLDKAKQAMEAGRFKDALTPLNEAAKKVPDNDVIYFLRAQAHAALGNIADARRDAEKVADLAETDEDRKHAKRLAEMIAGAQTASAIKELLEKAKEDMEAGRFRDALTPLDLAADMAPESDVVYFLRAQARMASGDIRGALADVAKCEQLANSAEAKAVVKQLKQAMFGMNR